MILRSFLLPILALLCGCPFHAAPWILAQEASGRLTLPDALSRVFARHPELAVSELEIQAASARILQAGLRPNPVFTNEYEDFAAIGGSGLFPYTESTFQVSQLLELGGKRTLRVRSAEMELGVAGRELDMRKAELTAATGFAFADVLAAQERGRNLQELSRLVRQALETVAARVAAGKVSPIEEMRATVALASARLEEDRQRMATAAARDRLAALWGGSQLDFDGISGRFEIPPSPAGSGQPCLDRNPELRLADAAIESRRATLALEQAQKKPDLIVSAGFRCLNERGAAAWVAGISLPLNFFDKRQGAIAEARIRLNKSETEKRAIEWRLRAALTQARHDHETALLEAQELTRTVLPAAREAVASLDEGYRLGEFDYLDVLDAQRTYAELQRRYIEAVAAGLRAAIEIERLARCDSSMSVMMPATGAKEIGHEK